MSGFASQETFGATPSRAIEPSWLFWLAMFAASALGTNLGDFWAGKMALGLVASFAALAAASGLLIWGDRRYGRQTEAFYWLAIVILRAAATNVGDFLIHGAGVGFVLAILLLGAATLAAGAFTVAGGAGSASPRIDLRYWGAMAIGGAFGTVGGDFVSHGIGLSLATLALVAVMVVTIGARTLLAPTSMLGYWCIVLAERAAGTPAGDLLAEHRGIGLGLPAAMAITGATFVVVLGLRAARLKLPRLARA